MDHNLRGKGTGNQGETRGQKQAKNRKCSMGRGARFCKPTRLRKKKCELCQSRKKKGKVRRRVLRWGGDVATRQAIEGGGGGESMW